MNSFPHQVAGHADQLFCHPLDANKLLKYTNLKETQFYLAMQNDDKEWKRLLRPFLPKFYGHSETCVTIENLAFEYSSP